MNWANSHKTATVRKKLSRPALHLQDRGVFYNRSALDFGCGRGSDADLLGIEKYDPHYFPVLPVRQFDIVMCNYVLNVLPEAAMREQVLIDISDRLWPQSCAYISVRADKKELNGWTSRGTWQGYIDLEKDYSLEVYHSCRSFVMYRMWKDELCRSWNYFN